MTRGDREIAWAFGGLIVGGVVFFASRLVLGTGWLWWFPAMLAWLGISFYGIARGQR